MPQMIVRNPTALEVEAAAVIASKAFTKQSLEHWQDSFHTTAELFGERFILVVELDGELVSSLICTPGSIMRDGKIVSHSAAGAVGTLPEYRRMGCAGAMMTECAKLLHSEGICASSLWPFSYKYYRKFGWEVGAEWRAYSGPSSVFAEHGNSEKVRKADIEDLCSIKSVYVDFATQYNCLTVRTDSWWDRIVKINNYLKPLDKQGAIVHITDSEVDGYAVYDVETREEDNVVGVKEIVFKRHEHRRDMLAKLAMIDPKGQVNFGAPAGDLFLHELPEPRDVTTSVRPAFQFRIFDPQAALLALSPADDISGRLSFVLTDPVLEPVREIGVEISGGGVSICKPERASAMEMDIMTFAKIFSGYISPGDAWKIGKVKTDNNEVLELANRAFSTLDPYRSWIEPG